MSEAERLVHFGSSRSFLTQPADLLYGGLYGEGAGAWHEAFLHAMTLLESNAVDATRQAQAALTRCLGLAKSADAPRDRGVGAFPFDDGPAARSGAALAPGEPGGAGAAGAAGRAGAGAGAAPARSASTRRRRAASRFARAASASRCASDGGFFLRRSRAVDSSTACAPRRVRGDEPRSDEKLTAPRARRVRGAEDQALDQLAQGGAVARLRGEGGRVDYYARESRRDAGARFLGLFLFRLSGGIGVGWAPVAARRRRGGAGAGHAAHFVPQKECVCVGLLSAEPP